MADQHVEAVDQPFRVVLSAGPSEGNFVEGYKEQAQSEASAEARNARAEALGIEARYAAIAKP
jgi:hypothetical protein